MESKKLVLKNMKYVLWTIGIEMILFIGYIFYRAIKEIKEEENDTFPWDRLG
jgi:hypothetical protein